MKEILLAIHIEALPEGGFLATSQELPGLVAQGRTAAPASGDVRIPVNIS